MMDSEPQQMPEPHSPPGIPPMLRLVLYLVSLGIAWLIIAVTAGIVMAVFSLGNRIDPTQLGTSLSFLSAVYLPLSAVTVLITWGFVTYVDRRPIETLGFAFQGSWLAELLLGLSLGFGLPVLIFIVCYVMGWTQVTGSLFASAPSRIFTILLQTLALMIAVAVNEETIVRGYILQSLKLQYGGPAALVISSILFGLAHLGNPGALFTAFIGTFLAGMALGYAYLITKRLWLPIALHFSWNFTLGPVLGFPVSGIDLPGWIQQRVTGPALWTGGKFGPEAGIMGLAVWIIAIPVIIWFVRRVYRP